MAFNTNKCKVMHVGRTNQKFSYVMNGQILDRVDSEKDLGVMISSDLKSSISVYMLVVKLLRCLV